MASSERVHLKLSKRLNENTERMKMENHKKTTTRKKLILT
jgi:hypothetical protein